MTDTPTDAALVGLTEAQARQADRCIADAQAAGLHVDRRAVYRLLAPEPPPMAEMRRTLRRFVPWRLRVWWTLTEAARETWRRMTKGGKS